jgi:phage N-6-adenine-methyltransferase
VNNWRTPPEIFNKLNAEFKFDLDAAAEWGNAQCEHYLDDALNCSDWPGKRIWLNPP